MAEKIDLAECLD